ncbi:MAG: tetratricopeptide repeat protein [Bacteroidales bacterium]|nr:tetratricopeptide repeat protein [Bacteroidales bacterium]
MKKHLLTALFAVLVTVANAQSNFGTDYFAIGEIQIARKFFEKQLAQSPAESNYYLGEIAFAAGKPDEAKAYYEKGIAADPLYMLNYIGQGKLLLKSDAKAAEAIFSSALKKNKKNVELNVAVARAYFDCGMKDVALAKIEIARNIGKKSPLVYILEGDILKSDNKSGEAGGKFEQAIYFDSTCTVASIKCAQVYELINPALSIELLKKVIIAHPDYKVVYRLLGNSYSRSGHYQNAIESFKTFFAEGAYDVEDITKFASAYYFTDQYEQSAELVNKGLALDPANFVLNRLKMYNASKTKDATALPAADYFFTLKSAKGDFLPSDYMAYAVVLNNAGKYDKALEMFNKMLESDPSKAEVYKELYSVYSKMGDYIKGAASYKKYIQLVGADYVTAVDYFQLGRAYYYAGSAFKKDSTEAGKTQFKELLAQADSSFSIVCKLTPEGYTGFLWRGHTNAMLDSDMTQGLAKPYYEAAMTIILNKAKETGLNGNKKDLADCYEYLGFYYYLKADKENAIKYWTLVLELKPNSANAKLVLDEYAKEVKK